MYSYLKDDKRDPPPGTYYNDFKQVPRPPDGWMGKSYSEIENGGEKMAADKIKGDKSAAEAEEEKEDGDGGGQKMAAAEGSSSKGSSSKDGEASSSKDREASGSKDGEGSSSAAAIEIDIDDD